MEIHPGKIIQIDEPRVIQISTVFHPNFNRIYVYALLDSGDIMSIAHDNQLTSDNWKKLPPIIQPAQNSQGPKTTIPNVGLPVDWDKI